MRNDLVVFSYHRRLSWIRCKLEHFLKYEKKLNKVIKNNSSLILGSAIHKALEEYYYCYREINDIEVIRIFNESLEEEGCNLEGILLSQLYNTGSKLLKIYLTADRKSGHKILGTEKQFILGLKPSGEITTDLDDKNLTCYIAGKIDLILEIDGKVYIIDYKTTGRSRNDFLSFMKFDEQLLTYSSYGKYTYPEFKGTIYNVLMTNAVINEAPIFREFIPYNPEEVHNVLMGYVHEAQKYYTFQTYPDIFQQREPDPMKCNSCDYKDPCILKRKGRNYQKILNDLYISYDKFDWEN